MYKLPAILIKCAMDYTYNPYDDDKLNEYLLDNMGSGGFMDRATYMGRRNTSSASPVSMKDVRNIASKSITELLMEAKKEHDDDLKRYESGDIETPHEAKIRATSLGVTGGLAGGLLGAFAGGVEGAFSKIDVNNRHLPTIRTGMAVGALLGSVGLGISTYMKERSKGRLPYPKPVDFDDREDVYYNKQLLKALKRPYTTDSNDTNSDIINYGLGIGDFIDPDFLIPG